MSDATSEETIVPVTDNQQETPDKSSVQKRIDELTAEKYAYAKQVEAMQNTVNELIKAQTAPKPVAQKEAEIPEGLDPGVAKWLMAQQKETAQMIQANTERMYWQMQNQLDQQQVSQKNAGLPPSVLNAAANKLTGLRQRYGDAANMDDAVKFALAEHVMSQMAAGKAIDFNNMNRALSPQGGSLPSPNGGGSNTLVPPTQLPNWESMDLQTQNKLISEYEKKGGSLF